MGVLTIAGPWLPQGGAPPIGGMRLVADYDVETGISSASDVHYLLVTADNADRFGVFELLPEPSSE